MKLLFVIPSLQAGGMERVMAILLQYFAKEYPELSLHLILYGRKRDVFYDLPPFITIHRPSFRFDNRLRLWHTLKTIWFLRKTINKLQPDSILSFGERWNNLVLLAGWGRGWPIYVSDRCQPDKSLGKFQDFLRKRFYPQAYGIIAQTEFAKEIYQKRRFNRNIPVIGNPIRSVPSKSVVEQKKIILSVGRLIRSKHHTELIRLFADINAPDWKLVIIGGDALQQNNSKVLKALVNKLNLNDRVILTGQVKDVELWYQKSKLFAFPSSSEGFPNVVGEALSYGLPVVAFNGVAGLRDLVQNGVNGYLVDYLNLTEFKIQLLRLMENEGLRKRMAEQAPETIQRFDRDVIAEKFFQTLTSHL